MPPTHSLTPRQERVVAFIRDFVAERGYPPTHAEIAAGLGFRSANAATDHLRRLARKGALAAEPRLSRGLRLLPSAPVTLLPPPFQRSADPSPPAGFWRSADPSDARRIVPKSGSERSQRGRSDDADDGSPPAGAGLPVIGEVAAGQPILAQENVERVLDVDPALFRPRADFLLRVRGDSMIEADLRPGDLAAVHRTPAVPEGAIAVVRLDDDVTVKRFRTRAGRGGSKTIVLEPANAALSPIVVDPARVTVAIEGRVVGLLRLSL
jgi:repressor LexA